MCAAEPAVWSDSSRCHTRCAVFGGFALAADGGGGAVWCYCDDVTVQVGEVEGGHAGLGDGGGEDAVRPNDQPSAGC